MSDVSGIVFHRIRSHSIFESPTAEGKDLRDPDVFREALDDGHRYYRGWYDGLSDYCVNVSLVEQPSYVFPPVLRLVSITLWLTLFKQLQGNRLLIPLRYLDYIFSNVHVALVIVATDADFVLFNYDMLSRPLQWFCELQGVETVSFFGVPVHRRSQSERARIAEYDYIMSGYEITEVWPEIEQKSHTIIQSPSRDSPYTKYFGCDRTIDVSLIGGFGGDSFETRTEFVTELIERLDDDIDFRIHGYAMGEDAVPSRLEDELGPPLYGEQYYETLGRSRIYLTIPNDYHIGIGETRPQGIMEPPAAGTFQLAYDTDRTRRIWRNGREVELFSDVDELVEKIERYLEDDERRRRIADAAHTRFQDEYTGEQQIISAFESFGILPG